MRIALDTNVLVSALIVSGDKRHMLALGRVDDIPIIAAAAAADRVARDAGSDETGRISAIPVPEPLEEQR